MFFSYKLQKAFINTCVAGYSLVIAITVLIRYIVVIIHQITKFRLIQVIYSD